MKKIYFILFLTISVFIRGNVAECQVYLDPKVSVEDRVNDLLSRLTDQEKLSYIGGINSFYIRPVSRLKIPQISMSDGPVGVRNWGNTTAYPAGILTAATWDTTLVNRLGHALGKDARSRGVHVLLGPGLNIYRAPMCGRNFEYFSEDPYLSSRMAVGYIKGVQAEKVVATAKHFAANNQEWDRNYVSSDIDERTFEEIYLPAFKASVMEAKVGAVMSSYNLINGTWASHNHHLLTEILKDDWKFDGFVMSDWGAVHNGPQAALAGLDLEMPSASYMNSTNLSAQIASGTIPQSLIDDKVRRILRVLFRFGFFDQEQTDASIAKDYAPNGEVALDLARSGIVLLKNQDAVLPLDTSVVKSIVVVGENGDAYVAGGGSSYTTPFHYTTLLEGIRAEVGEGYPLDFQPGLGDESSAYGNAVFYTDNTLTTQGLTGLYYANKTFSGTAVTRIDQTVNFNWAAAAPGVTGIAVDNFSVRWTGVLKVPETGDYMFYLRSDDGSRLWIDNNQIITQWVDQAAVTKQATIHLEKDEVYNVKLEYYESAGDAEVRMGYKLLGFEDAPAVVAAKNADAAIVCVGFNSNLEGEGFDRKFELPAFQDSMINAIAKVNPRTIVVLNAGGNVATETWLKNANALLQAWYPGQEGGTAIAEILFGKTNPSGKLPASFEKKWEDNPTYNSYYDPDGDKRVSYSEGLFVGYRYYDSKNVDPLFPFGFGLSYTTFDYSNLVITPSETGNPNSVEVSFDVTNSGGVAGAEVAQLYIHEMAPKVERPEKELKGFSKVFLNPGETKSVTMKLDSASFSYFKIRKMAFGYDPGSFDILVGASSKDIRLTGSVTLSKNDETNPEIVDLTPETNTDQATKINTFSIKFSEPVYYNTDKEIVIRNFDTGSVFEKIKASAIEGKGSEVMSFSNSTQLKGNVKYYIEMPDSAFIDYSDNPCAGISGKDTWNFMVNTTGARELEQMSAALMIYPNPTDGKILLNGLPEQSRRVTVSVYDLAGRKADSFGVQAGQTFCEYDASALGRGVYFVHVPTDAGTLIKKLVKK